MQRMMDSALPQCASTSVANAQGGAAASAQTGAGRVAVSALAQAPSLPNNTDLNTVMEAGTYLVLHNGKDRVTKNCPTYGTYKLSVDVLTSKVLRQTLIAGNSYNIFVRSFAYDKWTEWKNVTGMDSNIQQCAEIVRGSFLLKLERKLMTLFRRKKNA